MGWDGHLSPEAKGLKQFSLSSQRLLCKQEVCETDLTGTLSLQGLEGLNSICQGGVFVLNAVSTGKEHVVWEAGAPVKWQQPL